MSSFNIYSSREPLPLTFRPSFVVCLGSFFQYYITVPGDTKLTCAWNPEATCSSLAKLYNVALFVSAWQNATVYRTDSVGNHLFFLLQTQVKETMLEDGHFFSSCCPQPIMLWDMSPTWMWPISTLPVSIRKGSHLGWRQWESGSVWFSSKEEHHIKGPAARSGLLIIIGSQPEHQGKSLIQRHWERQTCWGRSSWRVRDDCMPTRLCCSWMLFTSFR